MYIAHLPQLHQNVGEDGRLVFLAFHGVLHLVFVVLINIVLGIKKKKKKEGEKKYVYIKQKKRFQCFVKTKKKVPQNSIQKMHRFS